MKIPRALAVFLGAGGTMLLAAVIKALAVSGMETLPPVKVLAYATTTFGLVAALIDWGILRDLFPGTRPKPDRGDSVIVRARRRPIVFREICPPPVRAGLSFYGGAPVGPSTLAWPRLRNKSGEAPLSFVMQWDLAELAREDATGLLPGDGVLYLFADLSWGEPFDFQFVHEAGAVAGWRVLPVPAGLPAIYGDEGVYSVPYCSPQIAKEQQEVPQLLPKWYFSPKAFSYPATGADGYWNDGASTAEALLQLEDAAGGRNTGEPPRFGRPFAAFPHDYAAVRVVAAKVLEQLRHPERRVREASERWDSWRGEASRQYVWAASHAPGSRVEQSQSDEIWRWMAELEPLLGPGWGSLVADCVNVSLGLESEGANLLPAELVADCAWRHRLAWVSASSGDGAKPSVHAPCPNHMFGPPSDVQGAAEEYVPEWLLLLELSSRRPIGHEFGEGVLQFLILPGDLREGRFDRVKLIASAY